MTDRPGIEIQYAMSAEGLPAEDSVRQWAGLALADTAGNPELTIRIVDEAEITVLNHRYRGKDYPTNVLSFPYQALPGVESSLLGDVVICAPVVVREAVAQSKTLDAHWAHMVIHGVLHLLGYDHHDSGEATRMEQHETGLLNRLGYTDPYLSHSD